MSYTAKYAPDSILLLSSDFEATQLRANKLFTKDFGRWTCSENGVLLVEKAGFGSSTGVRLTPVGKCGSSMQWDLRDPRPFDFLELKGRIRVEDIIIGKEPWDMVRTLFYFKIVKGAVDGIISTRQKGFQVLHRGSFYFISAQLIFDTFKSTKQL